MFVDAELSRAEEPYSVGRSELNVATFAHVDDAPTECGILPAHAMRDPETKRRTFTEQ